MGARRAGLVLAGGRSVRMGRAKASLPWGARTMLEAVARTLGEACDAVVVVAHPGQALPPLPEGVTRVDDPADLDDQGPLVAVHAGLSALLDDDLVYLAATDKPHLTAEHVAWMFDRLEGADGVVPVEATDSARRHRMHPLSAVVRAAAARRVAADLIAQGERALRLVFERFSCVEVPVSTLPDPHVLTDYNTPEAYAAAVRELQA